MHALAAIVGLLFISTIYGETPPLMDDKHLCPDQMIRKAFSQAAYPDHEHEPMCSERYYDPIQEKCLTKVDEYCPEVDATCAPNSECRSINSVGYIKRKCYCTDGRTEYSENGTIPNFEKTYCGTRAGFGEECSTTHPYVACDPEHRLSCHNGKCGCQDPATMAYDATDNRCRLLSGVNCYRDGDCVDNAKCVQSNTEERKYMDICQCFHGTSKEGLCYRGFLQECSADRPCNDLRSLKCTDGICRCKEPLRQGYENDKCVLLAGKKCAGLVGECGRRAECVDGICRCAAGFSETADRRCRESGKGHGEECENVECDFYKGLACVDGSCQCVDPSLKFDENTKSCVAAIGSECGTLDIVGKDDGKCEVKDDDEHKVKDENIYGNNTDRPTCPHYYVACDGGRPCMQSATAGESYCM